jgi:hypothetical protein
MQRDLAFHDPPRMGDDSQNRQRRDAFAGATFADDTQGLAAGYLERGPIHRPNEPFLQEEMGSEVLDL